MNSFTYQFVNCNFHPSIWLTLHLTLEGRLSCHPWSSFNEKGWFSSRKLRQKSRRRGHLDGSSKGRTNSGWWIIFGLISHFLVRFSWRIIIIPADSLSHIKEQIEEEAFFISLKTFKVRASGHHFSNDQISKNRSSEKSLIFVLTNSSWVLQVCYCQIGTNDGTCWQ